MVREALTEGMLDALSAREAAAHFIARRAEGLNESESRLLTDWLAKDDAHRHMFESADRAWATFDGADGDEILAAMRAHALEKPHRRAWAPVGAVLATIAACAALVFFIPGLNPWRAEDPALTYASARGEVREIRLPDGSIMTLDAESSVIAHFGSQRSLTLQRGRVYLAVVHDSKRPFELSAGGRRVTDVGTHFDANLTEQGLTVTLLEGGIDISAAHSAGAPVRLVPGQQFVERQGIAQVRTIGDAGANTIAWRTGLINFDDQPLGEAATMMNRYSAEQVSIMDPMIAAIRVSGQFHAGETRRFAETLAEMHNLRVVSGANQIELSRP